MSDSRRCTATTTTGHRCKKYAIAGGHVCPSHGGAAPQVQAAAKMRRAREDAMAEASRMVARAGAKQDPIEHLLDSLHLAAQLVDVWGAMVAALDDRAAEEIGDGLRGELTYRRDKNADSPYSLSVASGDRLLTLNRYGEAMIHPFVVEYERALERRAKFAKLCIDAGIAERQVRIVEKQGQQIAQAITGMLERLGIEMTPEVSSVVGDELRKLTAPPPDPSAN